MNCAIYCRVSTERQKERHTIDSQIRILPELAKSKGYTLLQPYYIDDGFSAETVEGRPAFKKLLEDAEDKKFDAIGVIDFDRLTRSQKLIDLAIIKDIFRRNQIKIVTPSQEYDFQDEEDDFISDLMGILSKREKRKILKRMFRGRIEALKQGRYVGGFIPYGYVWNKEKKSYEIEPEEAKVIRIIFSLCNRGLSETSIVSHLNSINALSKTGKPWREGTVHRMLKNPAYYGDFHTNKKDKTGIKKEKDEWVIVKIPAIISKEEFDLAQEKLKARRLYSGKSNINDYLCSKLLYCGNCGKRMYGITVQGRKPEHAKHSYYRCCSRNWKKARIECDFPYLKVSDVDEAVWKCIENLIKNPEVLDKAIKTEEPIGTAEKDMKHYEKLLEKNELEKSRVLRLFRKGRISESDTDKQLEDITKEKELIEGNFNLSKMSKEKRHIDKKQLLSLQERIRGMRERLDKLTFLDKQQILRSICPGTGDNNIIVYKDGRIEINGVIDFDNIMNLQNNGVVNRTSLGHPREVFNPAIRESAAAVILVHNHPSGDPSPSEEDRELTRRLKKSGELLGIPVLDHIIIGDGKYLSFADKQWQG